MARCVIVTGASSGIGEAIANLYLKKGFSVIGIDINSSSIVNNNYFFLKMDVSKSTSHSQLIETIEKKSLEVIVVINSAAIQVEKTLLDTTEEEWDNVMAVNLKSIFLMSKLLVPKMPKEANIINISSVHSKATSGGMAAYVASKGAVSALTRAMAIELGDKNIRVNSVHPGAIETPMLEKGLDRSGNVEKAREKLTKSSPLNKIGSPLDVANLVYFLGNSSLAGNITGQEFYCDGGVMAKLASE